MLATVLDTTSGHYAVQRKRDVFLSALSLRKYFSASDGRELLTTSGLALPDLSPF